MSETIERYRASKVVVSFAVAALAAVTLCAGTAQASASKSLTLYAVPTTVQFMNHADDRIRGMANNPFAANAQALVIITKGKEKDNGPFPGDDVLYSFKLYSNAAATQKSVGSAMFTCYYDFVKHAICDAYFELHDGVLLASGGVEFNSKKFPLSVGGGDGKYLGATGQVNATVATNNAQQLDFVIT